MNWWTVWLERAFGRVKERLSSLVQHMGSVDSFAACFN